MKVFNPSLALVVATIAFGADPAYSQRLPSLPPLTDEPGQTLPGKFVWADLVTSEFDAARDFYQAVFGFDWELVSGEPQPYGILKNDGLPVAGIAYRARADGDDSPAQWIHFLSVSDVAASQQAMVSHGGETVFARRVYEGRGTLAIVAGRHGEVLGLIRSSSGDPGDYRSAAGDWLWRELLTQDPATSAATYRSVCGCEVTMSENRPDRYLMSSQGFLRAAISPLEDDEADAVWLGFIEVTDVTEVVDRAVAAGAALVVAPDPDVLGEHLAVLRDPVGAYFGLIAWIYADEGSVQP